MIWLGIFIGLTIFFGIKWAMVTSTYQQTLIRYLDMKTRYELLLWAHNMIEEDKKKRHGGRTNGNVVELFNDRVKPGGVGDNDSDAD